MIEQVPTETIFAEPNDPRTKAHLLPFALRTNQTRPESVSHALLRVVAHHNYRFRTSRGPRPVYHRP